MSLHRDDPQRPPPCTVGAGERNGGLPEAATTQQALLHCQNRLQSIVETAQEGVWEVDARWRTTFVSPRLAEMLGYTAEEMLGCHMLQFVFPEDRVAALERMREREAGRSTLETLRYRRRDGSELWARLAARPFLSADGQFHGAVGLLTDLTAQRRSEAEQQRLIEELRAAHARAQALSQQLVQWREQESARIARELHDELGQALTGLKLDLAWLERRLGRLPESETVAAMRARLQMMSQAVDATVLRTRRLCTELRPGVLDDLGLVAALEWQAREFQQRTNVAVALHLPTAVQLDSARATAVFRIFQEILTNVARHADAAHVFVRLQVGGDQLELEVRDDGRGFETGRLADSHALGLLGMKERAALCGGTLEMRSAPERGTTVTLRLPLHPAEPQTSRQAAS